MKEVTDTLKAEKEIIVSVFHHCVARYGASLGNMVPLPPASLGNNTFYSIDDTDVPEMILKYQNH